MVQEKLAFPERLLTNGAMQNSFTVDKLTVDEVRLCLQYLLAQCWRCQLDSKCEDVITFVADVRDYQLV